MSIVEKKEDTLTHIENAKAELDKAAERLKLQKTHELNELELDKVANLSRALLDINGVC